MAESGHTQRRQFGSIHADIVTQQRLYEAVRRTLETGAPLRVTYVNAHNVNVAEADPRYREALGTFDIVFPEGEGMAHAVRTLGYTPYEKFHTTDFWPKLFPLFQKHNAPVFLLGSTRDTLEKARERFTALGISVAGTADGFAEADNAEQTVEAINASGAKVLFIGMGVPRQELWVAAHRGALQPPLIVCAGNYLEFFAGTVSRAPGFMRRIGLEWLHRLIVEPKRLWKRYVLGIPKYWAIIRRQKAASQD